MLEEDGRVENQVAAGAEGGRGDEEAERGPGGRGAGGHGEDGADEEGGVEGRLAADDVGEEAPE